MTRYRTIVADPPWPYQERNAAWVQRNDGELLPYRTMSLDQIEALPVADMADGAAHLYLWTTSRYLFDAKTIAEAWGFTYAATLVWCKPSRGFNLGGTFQNNVEFALFCRRRWDGSPDVLRVTSYLADAAAAAGMTPQQVDTAMGTKQMARVWWLTKAPHRCACPTWENWLKLKRILGLSDEMDAEVRRLNEAKAGPAPQAVSSRWFQWPRGEHSAKPDAFLDMVEQVSPGPYVELFARRARFGWDYWGDESLQTVEMPDAA